ncbi:MAG: anaerobic ribonucleoside-triphosphate reductase activating protein [Oscillospiraceae bacterium]|nr:anaerobic ribonucleoside-triphosphate reductase activating protein [Oscillospiraceae bacterium]
MRIAGTVQDSIVDGPGFRFVLFTQGCPHHCEGCQNPQTHDPAGGEELSVEEIVRRLLSNPLTDGITFSGGEPFEQAADCALIARQAREKGLNVWTYTGYTFEQLLERMKTDDGTKELLSVTDVLVDGRFVLAQKSFDVPWRGSRNQRLIDVPKSLESGRVIERES